MDKRYSTIIFVPHARAKFRKLKVSHHLLFSVLSIVTYERIGRKHQTRWLVGTAITQMSDSDVARLTAYLEKRAKSEPILSFA